MNVSSSSVSQFFPVDSSPRAQDAHFRSSLFNSTFIKLAKDLRDIDIRLTGDEKNAKIEEIVLNSKVYSLMQGMSASSVPIHMDTFLLTILELNDADEELLPFLKDSIVQCVRKLIKSKDWDVHYAKLFNIELSNLEDQRNLDLETITPVQDLVSLLQSEVYLDPLTQVFVQSTIYDQLEPIRKIYGKKDLSKTSTVKKIVDIAVEYPTSSVKKAFYMFDNKVEHIPLLNLSEKIQGLGLFRENSIATKRQYLKSYRKKCFTAFDLALTKKSKDRILTKKFVFQEVFHVARLLVSHDGNLKAFIISKEGEELNDYDHENSNHDLYLLVEKVKAPEVEPSDRLLYDKLLMMKFALVPGTNAICLVKAHKEIRETIISTIEENKLSCLFHTAIKYKKEYMLVEIIRQMGTMLNGRVLLGAIKTYIAAQSDLTREQKSELESIYTAVYYLPLTHHLSGWWHEKAFDIPLPKSHRVNPKTNSALMQRLKNDTTTAIEKSKVAFEYTDLAMWATGYENPLKALKEKAEEALTQEEKSLRLNECIFFLCEWIQAKENKQSILSLLELIRESLLRMMGNFKKNHVILKKGLEVWGIKGLDDILYTKDSNDFKTTKILKALFHTDIGLTSLEKLCSPSQFKFINAFLDSPLRNSEEKK